MPRRALGRLGLRELATDHLASWVVQDEHGRDHRSWADVGVFVAAPLGLGAATWWAGVRLYNLEAPLAAASILTALLFGLLVHVLSLGLQIDQDSRIRPGGRIVMLTDELRANVAWACATGLALSGVLAVVGAITRDIAQTGVSPAITGVVAALGAHLVGTLLMILKRVRSTYKMLGKSR